MSSKQVKPQRMTGFQNENTLLEISINHGLGRYLWNKNCFEIILWNRGMSIIIFLYSILFGYVSSMGNSMEGHWTVCPAPICPVSWNTQGRWCLPLRMGRHTNIWNNGSPTKRMKYICSNPDADDVTAKRPERERQISYATTLMESKIAFKWNQ